MDCQFGVLWDRLADDSLAPCTKLIMIALVRRANDTGKCNVTYKELMADTGIGSRATIASGLRQLQEHGIINGTSKSGGSTYEFIVEVENV